MTDGIIQKEFNEFRSHYLGVSITHERLYYLERHIIEKIKQDFPITEPFLHVYGVNRVRRMLIGDNQE